MKKKLVSLTLAVVMLFSVSLAFAKTVEMEDTDYEHLAGIVVNATVGEYDEVSKTLTVTLYEDDAYDIEDVLKLEAGDVFLAGGHLFKVKEVKLEEDGSVHVTTEEGEEMYFITVGDEDMIVQSSINDRRYMHAFAILHLPVAENLVYEDDSDPEKENAVVTTGLEEILKIKAEKEETSIGFDYYSTIIELNENLEIVRIHQDYDVAQ
ncbi:MAG: hypothetical protein IKO25_07745 [Clostridia bacterium]|nr:hypothetical protein [Clostridia bacterium]